MMTATLFHRLRNLLVLPILAGLTGCSEETTQQAAAEFELLVPSVELPAEAGEAAIAYRIGRPVGGARIEAECDDEWIHTFSTTEEGFLFRYDANPEDRQRATTLRLSYAGIERSLPVKQAAAADFAIMLHQVAPRSVTFDIIPADKEMTYVTMLVELAERVPDETLLEDDRYYFEMMAAMYGLSLEEYLTRFKLKSGDRIDVTQSKLKPDTDYLLYVYGLSPQGELLTDLCKKEFRTVLPERIDISFEIGYAIDATAVQATIEPSRTDCPYLFEIVEQGSVTTLEQTVADYQLELLETVDYYIDHGMSAEDYIRSIALTGRSVTASEGLKADTRYIGFAVAVDPRTGLLVSEASAREFVTGKVEPSDNVLTLQTIEIGDRSVDFRITTTNDDPYVFGVGEAKNWEGLSDDAIVELLLKEYNLQDYVLHGDAQERITDLRPETAYIAFAFGYVSGIATTAPVMLRFSTDERVVADVGFTLVYDRYWDGDALSAVLPEYAESAGLAVLPVKARPDADAAGYYYGIYTGDFSDPASISDIEVIEALLDSGSTAAETDYYLPYGEPCTAFGIAVDEAGNYGPIFRARIVLDKEHASPVEEFAAPLQPETARADRIAHTSAGDGSLLHPLRKR